VIFSQLLLVCASHFTVQTCCCHVLRIFWNVISNRHNTVNDDTVNWLVWDSASQVFIQWNHTWTWWAKTYDMQSTLSCSAANEDYNGETSSLPVLDCLLSADFKNLPPKFRCVCSAWGLYVRL